MSKDTEDFVQKLLAASEAPENYWARPWMQQAALLIEKPTETWKDPEKELPPIGRLVVAVWKSRSGIEVVQLARCPRNVVVPSDCHAYRGGWWYTRQGTEVTPPWLWAYAPEVE